MSIKTFIKEWKEEFILAALIFIPLIIFIYVSELCQSPELECEEFCAPQKYYYSRGEFGADNCFCRANATLSTMREEDLK